MQRNCCLIAFLSVTMLSSISLSRAFSVGAFSCRGIGAMGTRYLRPTESFRTASSRKENCPSSLSLQAVDASGTAAKTALCILAEGVEELEAIAPIDILRRANVKVTTASLSADVTVTGRNGIKILADMNLDAALKLGPFDAVIVPGGPPAVPSIGTLQKDARVIQLLQEQKKAGRLVSAICAGPTVLHAAGVLGGQYTAHFSTLPTLPSIDRSQAVVRDGNILTSQGAGTAVDFGLALAEALTGPTVSAEIAQSICCGPHSKK